MIVSFKYKNVLDVIHWIKWKYRYKMVKYDSCLDNSPGIALQEGLNAKKNFYFLGIEILLDRNLWYCPYYCLGEVYEGKRSNYDKS